MIRIKRLPLIVDEWGTWYDVEPGTNPGFLFQQNSMRDAMVAGINLNIFNNHCDRVKGRKHCPDGECASVDYFH